jgi:hypothetical protein
MITINVQGHGSFVIPTDKIDEILSWLRRNSMPVENNNSSNDTLLNG